MDLAFLISLRSVYTTLILLCLSLIAVIFYRLFFHPLARFPGPKLAAVTRCYEAYYDIIKGGTYIFKISELHRRYGPVVRISPGEIHVDDPAFFNQLYNYEGRWNKDGYAYRPFGFGVTTFTALDHDKHHEKRQQLDPFFSPTVVASLKPILDTHIEKFSKRIEEFAVSGKSLLIGVAYSALTMDIITEYATGTSYDNLSIEDFNQALVDCFAGFGVVWRSAKHVPWLLPLFMSLPSWMMRMMSAKTREYRALQEHCLRQIRTLKATTTTQSVIFEGKLHKTIFHEFLTTDALPAQDRTIPALRGQLEELIGAGTEPTAHAMRIITYHLSTSPRILAKLRAELDGLKTSSSHTINLQDLKSLSYLTAIIQEGLRLSYGVATRIPRIATDRVLEYGTWKIPAGTPVSMTPALLWHEEAMFPDSNTFSPERFLSAEGKEKMEACFAPFLRGARSCLGKHLASAELYLTTAVLFSRFDFQLYETPIENIQLGSDGYMPIMKRSGGVRVLVKKRGEGSSVGGKA